MQMRGRTPSWPHPHPGRPSSECPGCALPSQLLLPRTGPGACPRLPRAAPTPLQPKGNKYKLYKVNGGPTPPGVGQQAEGGASRRAGPGWPLLWTASHHSQLQQRVGIRHGLDVGVRLRQGRKERQSEDPPQAAPARALPPSLPPQATYHCCELVELGPQVRALEVDVGGFVSHLVTAGTGAEGLYGWGWRLREGGKREEAGGLREEEKGEIHWP